MILVIKLLLNTIRFLILLYSLILNILLLLYIYFSTSVDLIWTYISIQLSYCYLATVHIIRIIKINN